MTSLAEQAKLRAAQALETNRDRTNRHTARMNTIGVTTLRAAGNSSRKVGNGATRLNSTETSGAQAVGQPIAAPSGRALGMPEAPQVVDLQPIQDQLTAIATQLNFLFQSGASDPTDAGIPVVEKGFYYDTTNKRNFIGVNGNWEPWGNRGFEEGVGGLFPVIGDMRKASDDTPQRWNGTAWVGKSCP